MIRQRALLRSFIPELLCALCAGSLANRASATILDPPVPQAAPGQTVATQPLVPAPGAERIFVDMHHSDAAATLHLAIGRSLVLTTQTPLKRIYIGNPLVLQSYASGDKEIVLTAKSYGVSSLVLWDTSGQYHIYSFSADVDSDGVRSAFKTAFPEGNIEVEAREGKLFVTGTVPTDAALDAASKMAVSYAKDVVNAVRVLPAHGKQVQLKLRIIEVDRSKAEQFGFNIFTGGGHTISGISTQQFPSVVSVSPAANGTPASVSITNPLNFFLYNFGANVGVTLQDLENKQVLQVLAEPTLTTLSGTAAHFLSGGEFPVPVVQGGTGNSTAITIMYRPYGVKVDFTPLVNDDGTIRLKIAPEVSALDYTNSVTISGSTIPALSTRRAETEVELRSGESFILSGLLDHRTTDALANVPGISSVPILGQLFRSKNINHSIVELVVIVTASVVDPLTKPIETAEPKMAVPNMNSNIFDVRIKAILNSKNIFSPTSSVTDPAPTTNPASSTAPAPPTEKP